MKKQIQLLTALTFLTIGSASAQQGFGTSSPAPSSVIDAVSANKGVLLPRVTLTGITDVTTVPNAVNALTVFNTATTPGLTTPNHVTPGYYYWNSASGKWTRLLTIVDQDLHRIRGTNGYSHITNDAGFDGLGLDGGSQNIGIGPNALSMILPGGEQNIAIGDDYVLGSTTTGRSNVAIGSLAMAYNKTGKENVALGLWALSGQNDGSLTGNGNVALGAFTSNENVSGSNNTALGIYSGVTTGALNNTTAIGANARVSASNSIVLGTTGANAPKVGIGMEAPSNTLHVKPILTTDNPVRFEGLQTGLATDNIVVADADGVLKTIAASTLATSITADNGLSNNLNNIQLGGALIIPTTITTDAANTLTIAGLATGASTDELIVVDGTTGVLRKIAPSAVDIKLIAGNHISQDAGIGSDGTSVTGYGQIAIGADALNGTTLQNDNIAIGSQAAKDATLGFSNIIMGNNAAKSGTLGYENIVMGTIAATNATGGNYNIMLGPNAGAVNAGDYNTFIGDAAGYHTTGTGNTFLGPSSGRNVTSGSNNIVIGNGVGNVGDNAGSNQLNIGNWIFGNNGKIGLGNATVPTNTLHIKGVVDPVRFENLQTGLATDKIVVADATGVLKTIAASSIPSTNIYSANGTLTAARTVTMANNNLGFIGGNVGIGTAAPVAKLEVETATGDNIRITTGISKWALTSTVGSGSNSSNSFGIIDRVTGVRRMIFNDNGNVYLGGTIGSDAGSSSVLSVVGSNIGIGTIAPATTLQVNGSISGKTSFYAGGSSITAAVTDYYVATSGAGVLAYSLPAPASFPGRTLIFSASVGTTIHLTTPSGLIFSSAGTNSSATTQTLAVNKRQMMISDGANWLVISQF